MFCTSFNPTPTRLLPGQLRATGALLWCMVATPIVLGQVTPPPNQPSPYVLKQDSEGITLAAGAVGRVGNFRFRYGEDVRAVSFSSDGKTLAASGMNNVVRVWVVASGKRLIQGEINGFNLGRQDDVAYTTDGSSVLVLLAGYNGLFRLSITDRQQEFVPITPRNWTVARFGSLRIQLGRQSIGNVIRGSSQCD